MLGLEESAIRPGRMSYELRRLRLHGLIERLAKSHRYRLTARGLRTAIFYQRVYAKVLRPGLSLLHEPQRAEPSSISRAVHKLHAEIDHFLLRQAA